jgi:hypothetical protein
MFLHARCGYGRLGGKPVYLLRYSTRPMSGSRSAAHDGAFCINYPTLDHAVEGARVAMAADPSIFVAIPSRDGELVYTTTELRRRLAAHPEDYPTPP